MAHFLRVMTEKTGTPTIPELVQALQQDGLILDNTYPAKDDPRYTEEDWRRLHLSYDKFRQSVMLDRSVDDEADPAQEFAEDIADFLGVLNPMPDSPGKEAVAKVLNESKQIFACYIPDDITEQGWEVVEKVLEYLLEKMDGHLQVDGEGFYDKEGELLLEME